MAGMLYLGIDPDSLAQVLAGVPDIVVWAGVEDLGQFAGNHRRCIHLVRLPDGYRA